MDLFWRDIALVSALLHMTYYNLVCRHANPTFDFDCHNWKHISMDSWIIILYVLFSDVFFPDLNNYFKYNNVS